MPIWQCHNDSTAVSQRATTKKTAGISWLKPTASEHIAQMRALVAILEGNGYRVSQITTDRPGYVVFEDDHQVVAEPFRGE